MMSILLFASGKNVLLRINEHRPVVEFPNDFQKMGEVTPSEAESKYGIKVKVCHNQITVKKKLGLKEHILGLGEKALDIDKRRTRMTMWNFDQNGYHRGDDPLYLSVPFFISVNKEIQGVFVNSTAKVHFDFGINDQENITITVEDTSVDIYLFEGNSIESIVEGYISLTGKPMKIPDWSLEPHVSKYSYYPQERVLDVVDEYLKEMPISAVHLDIDYMDKYKLFTWDKKRFPSPEKLLEDLHKRNVKLVTIIDPGIKVEEDYEPFSDGLGGYVATPHDEIYTGKLWPGKSAFPDFLSSKGQQYWKKEIIEFSKCGMDGIWLDMNEPTVLNEVRTIDDDARHKELNTEHSRVHNAYAYYQAKATFEAFSSVREEPFILSRSGFAGIQKYACIWTGDSHSTWDDLSLQISMVCSLGLSGVPFTGCDIGGFMGSSEPELVARYYQVAAFFPLYRNHNDKFSVDQELFTLPDKYRKMALNGVNLRMKFLPYLIKLAQEAHEIGHPVVRPLCYEYFDDENSYAVNDEYMLGKDILIAPIVQKGTSSRSVYLPAGKWISYYTGEKFDGCKWIDSDCEIPLFLREGSEIPIEGGLLVCGKNDTRSETIEITDSKVKRIEVLGLTVSNATQEGKSVKLTQSGASTLLEGVQTGKIELS